MRFNRTLILLYAATSLLIGCKTQKIQYLPQVSYNTNIVIDNSITPDSTIIAYYAPYKVKLEKEMNRQIGYSDYYLSKVRSQPEFLVGNFFADALLTIGKQIDPETQLSLATKDGIRTEVKQGPITVGSMFELMPFENTITVLELKGTDVLELCEFIAKAGGQPIAGFTMQIENDKPVNININGQPLDTNKTYKLVTYDYLANGGDYIKGITNPISRINTPNTVREELIRYVEELTSKGKHVNTQLDGRITILK